MREIPWLGADCLQLRTSVRIHQLKFPASASTDFSYSINEVCSRLQSKPLFSPKPKRLTKESHSEGLAGVVEEGSLVKVDRRLDSSAQTTLERLRAELNQKQEKKVHTITELRARRAAVTISGTSQ